MGDLGKRIFTGLAYVSILILSTQNATFFALLFFIFGIISLVEYRALMKLHWNTLYLIVPFLAIHFVTDHLKIPLLIAVVAIDLYLLYLLFYKVPASFSNVSKYIIGLFYVGGGVVFIKELPNTINSEFSSAFALGILVLVWVNDTFAYIIGKMYGKTKLYSRISPRKTVEGFMGGLVFGIIVSILFYFYIDIGLSFLMWIILAVLVSLFGTFGDLVESMFKRFSGVKDSGSILPGHGGLLDRLDSLIFVSPFIVLAFKLFRNVS